MSDEFSKTMILVIYDSPCYGIRSQAIVTFHLFVRGDSGYDDKVTLSLN